LKVDEQLEESMTKQHEHFRAGFSKLLDETDWPPKALASGDKQAASQERAVRDDARYVMAQMLLKLLQNGWTDLSLQALREGIGSATRPTKGGKKTSGPGGPDTERDPPP
jgi:hypothetical protein